MSDALELVFATVKSQPSDMEGHMDTLRKYSSLCGKVVEFGVHDCTSTWALLAGRPGRLMSYDIVRKPEVSEVERVAEQCGVDFKFTLASSTSVDIGPVDMLFIDSLHTYDHITQELSMHEGNVRKFIVMHDTVTFGHTDETNTGLGLWPAVEAFLKNRPEWVIKEHFTHCHGLTILARQA